MCFSPVPQCATLGIEASKQKEKAFFELAERSALQKIQPKSKQLGHELGRFVFGE